MRFGRRDIWKIGHTQDVERRLDELNLHVPHEALNERWTLVHRHRWADSIRAFEMEQLLFQALQSHRTLGERLACSEPKISEAWRECSSALELSTVQPNPSRR